jgi:hypothetical protein
MEFLASRDRPVLVAIFREQTVLVDLDRVAVGAGLSGPTGCARE